MSHSSLTNSHHSLSKSLKKPMDDTAFRWPVSSKTWWDGLQTQKSNDQLSGYTYWHLNSKRRYGRKEALTLLGKSSSSRTALEHPGEEWQLLKRQRSFWGSTLLSLLTSSSKVGYVGLTSACYNRTITVKMPTYEANTDSRMGTAAGWVLVSGVLVVFLSKDMVPYTASHLWAGAQAWT